MVVATDHMLCTKHHKVEQFLDCRTVRGQYGSIGVANAMGERNRRYQNSGESHRSQDEPGFRV
jgi:hypothetical protein